MRPCPYCGHALTNNLKECEKCHKPVAETIGINTDPIDIDAADAEGPDAPAIAYVGIAAAVLCAFLLPPVAGYFAGGFFGMLGGFVVTVSALTMIDVPSLLSF